MVTMFTNDEWETILAWARDKIRQELEQKGGQASIVRSTGIPSATVNRWRLRSATPKNPSKEKVQTIIEEHWRMDRAAVLRAAMGVESMPSPAPQPMPRRGRIPAELSEAINLRIDRWLGSTIDKLRAIASDSGLRCSVGGWVDAGDELDRQRRADRDAEKRAARDQKGARRA